MPLALPAVWAMALAGALHAQDSGHALLSRDELLRRLKDGQKVDGVDPKKERPATPPPQAAPPQIEVVRDEFNPKTVYRAPTFNFDGKDPYDHVQWGLIGYTEGTSRTYVIYSDVRSNSSILYDSGPLDAKFCSIALSGVGALPLYYWQDTEDWYRVELDGELSLAQMRQGAISGLRFKFACRGDNWRDYVLEIPAAHVKALLTSMGVK